MVSPKLADGAWHSFGMMPKERPTTRQGKARKLLSVPLTPERHAELERRAGRQPVSAYVRGLLFPANDNSPARKHRRTFKEAAALASVLALLGPVAQVLKQLAQGIASGLIPFEPDTEAAILKACRDIAEMKALLMKALGIRER